MEGKLNKKLILTCIKYGPWVIGIGYFLQIILACFGIQSILLASLFGVSFVSVTLLILFSVFLGYCIWNRLPLYYVLTTNVVNIVDFYIGIPIAGKWILIVYVLLALIIVLIGAWIKNRENVRKRNFEENT